jgi:hypothetical protein
VEPDVKYFRFSYVREAHGIDPWTVIHLPNSRVFDSVRLRLEPAARWYVCGEFLTASTSAGDEGMIVISAHAEKDIFDNVDVICNPSNVSAKPVNKG